MQQFTVFSLTYGDHPELADRCFSSIRRTLDPKLVAEIRIGFNEVSEETRKLTKKIFKGCPVPVSIFDPGKNVFKYPLMRKMFYSDSVWTKYVMWFDDDSCLTKDATPAWWKVVAKRMQHADMLGDIWTMPLQGDQPHIIKNQKWYRGVPYGLDRKRRPSMRFATGGWWTIKADLLWKWDYPWPALVHNGGDSTLGEMLHQQRLDLVEFRENLWINADETGGRSTAARRGASQKPVWYKRFEDADPANFAHNNFQVTPYRIDQEEPEPSPITSTPKSNIIRIPGYED